MTMLPAWISKQLRLSYAGRAFNIDPYEKLLKKTFPYTLKYDDLYNQPLPPLEMIWEVCRYTRTGADRCMRCPEWENHPRHGRVTLGCFGLAAEACRAAIAMQRKLA